MTIEADEPATFDTHWEDLYASGQHLNRWPYDHVISFLKRGSSRLGYSVTPPLRLLEVGFGAGNNLLAAAVEGFSVAGIDGSPSAVGFAQTRFDNEGVSGELVVGDFVDLPWGDAQFDFVVDRLALTNSTPTGIRRAISEIYRVLRPGALFQFNALGVVAPADREVSVGDGMTHMTEMGGSLTGVGGVTLFNEEGVRALFPASLWKVEAFQEVVTRGIGKTSAFQPNEIQSEWRVVVRKRGQASTGMP